jgi:hypothetical protein
VSTTDPDESGRSKRRHTRVSVPLLVQYRFGKAEDYEIDYALNVSQSGLLLDAQTDKPDGTRVFIQLTTRDGLHLLQGEGKVIRTARGTAIELVGFSDESREILDALVLKVLEERPGSEA